MASIKGFDAGATVSLAVTSTTGNVAFGSIGDLALIQNTGSKTAYFKRHTVSSGTAAVTDTPLQAGGAIVISQHTSLYLAAICGGSDTTTLYITSGSGDAELTTAASASLSGLTVTSVSEANATAAAPSYSEGTENPISQTLTGDQRVTAKLPEVSTPITPATATATKGVLLGVQYNSTQATFTNGQQGSVQGTARGAVMVATGADAFTATTNADAAIAAGTAPSKALVAGAVYNSSAPAPTTGQTLALQADASGRLLHRNSPASTGAMASVASSGSSVTVLAANTARIGAAVYNDSTQILYLLLVTGGTASTTVYTVQMAAASYYEVPSYYTGALIGIWASANGNARVTEFTV